MRKGGRVIIISIIIIVAITFRRTSWPDRRWAVTGNNVSHCVCPGPSRRTADASCAKASNG